MVSARRNDVDEVGVLGRTHCYDASACTGNSVNK